MKNYTVLLDNGTVGTIAEDTIDYSEINGWIGEIVRQVAEIEPGFRAHG